MAPFKAAASDCADSVHRQGHLRPNRNGAVRVLIIVENNAVGMDNRLSKQIGSLVQSGHAVRVITRRHPSNATYRALPGVRLFEYRSPAEPAGLPGYVVEYVYSFLMAIALSIRVLLRERIDVVQFCQPPDVYFLLAPVFRWTGSRVIVDQRDLLAELYMARYGRVSRGLLWVFSLFEKLSQRSADHVLCVNEYLRKRALAASHLPPASVSVVRNGPVLALVAGATANDTLKRGRQHLCCWVGEIGRQDRVDLLMRSIHQVVGRLGRVNCQFVVIGDGECLAEVKSLAQELGIDEFVHFPGFLSSEQVFQYLATADLGLDASLQAEVSPVKAMEYMAFGLPFVAFDLPETRAIAEGAAAFAKPGDIADHARNIDELMADAKRRAVLGSAGRLRVREELAWDHQAVTYVGAVDGLLETAGRS